MILYKNALIFLCQISVISNLELENSPGNHANLTPKRSKEVASSASFVRYRFYYPATRESWRHLVCKPLCGDHEGMTHSIYIYREPNMWYDHRKGRCIMSTMYRWTCKSVESKQMLPGTPNNQFKMDVWWNNHFLCKDSFINGCLGFQVHIFNGIFWFW